MAKITAGKIPKLPEIPAILPLHPLESPTRSHEEPKNYALKSMDEVYEKLEEATMYIERNPTLVRSITSFPYIAKSF